MPWEKFAETQYWHLALYAVYTAPVFMPIYFFSFALHSVWKLNKNALTLFWQKFRECNVLHKDSKELISRNIFSLKVNFLFFHTVHDWNFRTKLCIQHWVSILPLYSWQFDYLLGYHLTVHTKMPSIMWQFHVFFLVLEFYQGPLEWVNDAPLANF